jgi:hypothetical protein
VTVSTSLVGSGTREERVSPGSAGVLGRSFVGRFADDERHPVRQTTLAALCANGFAVGAGSTHDDLAV